MNENFIKEKLQSKSLPTDRMALITVAGVNYVDTFGATLYDVRSLIYYQTTLPDNNARDGILSILNAAWVSESLALVVYGEVGPVDAGNQQEIILKSISLYRP